MTPQSLLLGAALLAALIPGDPATAELTCLHPGYSMASVCLLPKNLCGS